MIQLLAQETSDPNALAEVIKNFAIPVVVISAIFSALMIFVVPREVRTVFKRELKSYFLY